MANNILESVYGLGDDTTLKSLKRIDTLVGKLDTENKKENEKEKKERKQDKLHQNRLAQLDKRKKGDSKKEPILKTLLGDKAKKKNKSNPMLGLALLGLGGLAVALSDENVRKKINKKKDELLDYLGKEINKKKNELIESIKKESAKALSEAINNMLPPRNAPNKPSPQGPNNTQQGNTFNNMEEKLADIENIESEMDTQEQLYRNYLIQPGGNDKSDAAMRDFYYDSNLIIKEYAGYLEQHINMSKQLDARVKQIENAEPGTIAHDMLELQIKNLKTNIKIKQGQLTTGEEKIKEIKEKEARMIERARKANSGRQLSQFEDYSVFEGSKFQTGGITGKKPRKNNGGEMEMMMDPRMQVQLRQEGGKIFLHWAASTYKSASPKYHATVQGDGSIVKTNDYDSFGGGHTSGRNSEGVGLSLAAMHGAQQNGSYGQYPVKKNQYESMAKLAAQILTSWGHDASYITKSNVQTHAEAANIGDSKGGYGPLTTTPIPRGDYRWDLWKLYESDAEGTGGPKIRNLIRKYMGSGDFELETTDADGHTLPSVPAPARQKTFMEKLQDAFGALGNVGIFAGTVLKGIGGFLLDKMGIDLSGLFGMFGMGQPQQKQEGGLIKGNAKAIYDRLIMGGMSIPASRGILANIGVETGYTYDPKTMQGNGGPGRGLVQWEKGGRYDTDRINLVDFAKSKGTTWDDLNTQVDFIMHEMNTHPEYMRLKPKLNAAKSTKDATELFLRDYEKAGSPHTERRHKVGNQLDQLGWKGPAKVGSKVGPAKVGTGNKLLDMFMGKQSGGMITPSRSTTSKHTNFQQNQQTFNQSRGAGRRQVVVVRRRAPQQPMQLPTPSPPQGILPSGGVNNIASINDMYSVVGMS